MLELLDHHHFYRRHHSFRSFMSVVQQGLKICGFWFQEKNCAAQNRSLWGYTYIVKWRLHPLLKAKCLSCLTIIIFIADTIALDHAWAWYFVSKIVLNYCKKRCSIIKNKIKPCRGSILSKASWSKVRIKKCLSCLTIIVFIADTIAFDYAWAWYFVSKIVLTRA